MGTMLQQKEHEYGGKDGVLLIDAYGCLWGFHGEKLPKKSPQSDIESAIRNGHQFRKIQRA